MFELIKIAGHSIEHRIEEAKRSGDKGCAYTQNKNVFIHEVRSGQNVSVDAFCHSHDDYEILIPLTPVPCLIQDDKVVFGEVGSCYPMPSGSKHGCSHKLTDVSYIVVVMQRDWFYSITHKMAKPVGAMQSFFCSNIIRDLIKMFQSIFKQDFELKEEMLNRLGESLLIEMIRQNFVEYKTTIYKTKEYQKGIRNIVTMMNEKYNQDFTIDELAQMCKMSKFHFIRSFKNYTSVPPLEYLHKIRCSRAKYLFETTNLLVKDVAKAVGFKSASAFVQVFKKQVGETPSEFCLRIETKQNYKNANTD